jgi:protein SCO1/2
VSVDPERDTPAAIAEYLGHFDASFVGATGSESRLAPLVAALGVTVEKHHHDGDHYSVTHNDTVYVIGPDAELVAIASGPHDPATLASDYIKILRRYWASHRTA